MINTITQAIVMLLFFAMLIQFLVDCIKGIVGTKVMQYVKPPVWSVLLGVTISLVFKLDFFAMFGYISGVPIVTILITGVMISAGAQPLHELIAKLRDSRTINKLGVNNNE